MNAKVEIPSFEEIVDKAKNYSFKNRDFTSIQNYSKEELDVLIDLALHIKTNFDEFKSRPFVQQNASKREMAGIDFGEPSTRTMMSSLAAAEYLGYNTMILKEDGSSSRAKGESLKHQMLMLLGYHLKFMVKREPFEGVPAWFSINRNFLQKQRMADGLPIQNVPLINAGDGAHQHPTQTLLDLMTIKEYHGRFDVPIACIGDNKYSRVVNSLIQVAPKVGIKEMRFVSPEIFQISPQQEMYLRSHGIKYEKTMDVESALKESLVAYVTRFQTDRLDEKLRGALEQMIEELQKNFQITYKRLEAAHPNLILMHALPVDRNIKEIADDADFHPKAKHFVQSQNGLYARMGLMTMIAGGIESQEWSAPTYESSAGRLIEMPVTYEKGSKPKNAFIVYEMQDNGVAIDHIISGSGRHVDRYFNKKLASHMITMGQNMRKKDGTLKDVVKIFNYSLQEEDINALGLRAGGCTMNVIEKGHVMHKYEPIPGDVLISLLNCTNSKCITNPEYKEGAETIHRRVGQDPETKKHLYSCVYCDTFSDRWRD